MSNESENKRIDLTQLEDLQSQWKINCTDQYADELFSHWICDRKEEIIAELKRCYAREDELLDALRIIRDDLDEEIAKAHFPSDKVAWQIRNFAHDASQ